MTGIFIRRWAGVLTAFAAMLAGCGGGGTETVTTALTAPLVSKLVVVSSPQMLITALSA